VIQFRWASEETAATWPAAGHIKAPAPRNAPRLERKSSSGRPRRNPSSGRHHRRRSDPGHRWAHSRISQGEVIEVSGERSKASSPALDLRQGKRPVETGVLPDHRSKVDFTGGRLPAEGGPRWLRRFFGRSTTTPPPSVRRSAVLPQGSFCFPLPAGSFLFPLRSSRWPRRVGSRDQAGFSNAGKATRPPVGLPSGQARVNINGVFFRSTDAPHPGEGRLCDSGGRLGLRRPQLSPSSHDLRLLPVLIHQGQQARQGAATSSKGSGGSDQSRPARRRSPKRNSPTSCNQP